MWGYELTLTVQGNWIDSNEPGFELQGSNMVEMGQFRIIRKQRIASYKGYRGGGVVQIGMKSLWSYLYCFETKEANGISILLAVGTPSTGSQNLYCQWELSSGSGNALCILFPTVFAPVARIEAIRLFLAYASFMGFMDFKTLIILIRFTKWSKHSMGCIKLIELDVKSASTPIETEKPLLKDLDGKDVDVHIYRSMIGSLMYLTSSRPDIMFAVCTIIATSSTKAEYVAAASCCAQATATIKKVNDVVQLRDLINGKKVVVTEDVISRDLHLDDADGVECLPNEEIFAKLTMVRNVDNPRKFLMYPRYLQVLINNQVDDLTSHNTKYTSLALTQKVFANMRRVRKGGCIQTGGKIKAIDADEDITLVDVETQEEVFDMNVELQGRIDQEDISTANKDVNAAKPTIFDDEEKCQSLKKKPVFIAQARKNMIIYLKNMDGYKMEHFRGMTYDKVRPIFEREYKKVQTLFKPDKDVEEPKKKRVAKDTLLQESSKKLKAAEVSGSESTQETPPNDPKEMTEEDVQNVLEIVPVSEFKVEALQVKYPIVDWEIHSEGSRTYWKIIRVGGITENYKLKKIMRRPEI
nr:retrotransposon protein, putative, Ty1-copia subclass [Tanacetum cinerariifolium]